EKFFFKMALKVERENPELDEPMLEFVNWLEELRRLRNEFDALLCQYEEKRARLIESLQE
ncbi:hypothetical protein KAV47_06060, partial [Candidatus Bathyarchaeota archaeon]|nr:hypothetical protein [Candidatus Bathyarchaeota archaeon]